MRVEDLPQPIPDGGAETLRHTAARLLSYLRTTALGYPAGRHPDAGIVSDFFAACKAAADALSDGGGSPNPGLIDAPLLSIDASGERAVWSGVPPVGAGVSLASTYQIPVTRQGFDSDGAAGNFPDFIRPTIRIRQYYPQHALLSDLDVGLSHQVFAGDTITGVTNNSTLASPIPLVVWTDPERLVIGDSHRARVSAFHISGVAAVKFIWTDAAGTQVTRTVSEQSCRLGARTGFAKIEFDSGDVGISSLADGRIRLDVEVYPRCGTSASVFRSASLTDRWDSRSQYFRKHPAMFAAPVHACWSDSGNDTTGTATVVEADAIAAPFLTVNAAMNAIAAGNNATYGVNAVDGGRLHPLGTATYTAPVASKQQHVAALIMEPISSHVGRLSRSWDTLNTRITGSDAQVPDQSYIFRRLAITRSASATSFVSTSGQTGIYQFIDCDIDAAGIGTGNVTSSGAGTARFWSTQFSNMGASSAWLGGTGACSGFVDCLGAMNDAPIVGFGVVACNFSNTRIGSSGSAVHQFFVLSTRVSTVLNTGLGVLATNAANLLARGAFVGNFETEECAGYERNFFYFANDGTTTSSNHVLMWHWSVAGAGGNARANIAYNDVVGVNNRHANWSIKGVIHQGRMPSKTETFVATRPGWDNGNYRGNWGVIFGTGCHGNVVGAYPATVGVIEYFGDKSRYPANDLEVIDPMFTDNRASTATDNRIATPGGTDFTLLAGSPGIGIVDNTPLPWTIAGLPRPALGANAGSR